MGTRDAIQRVKVLIMRPIFNLILLLAYCRCFNEKETKLHLSTFLARDFTSSTILARRYIALLHQNKSIKLSRSNVRLPLAVPFKFSQLYLTAPNLCDVGTNAIKYAVRAQLNTSLLATRQFEDIILDLMASDSIEYVDHYVKEEGTYLCSIDLHDARLRMLLYTRSLGQVFMLLWRAVKNSSFRRNLSPVPVQFSEIIELAWRYNFKYQSRGASLEHYTRPDWLPFSKVHSLLYFELMKLSGNVDQFIGPQAYLENWSMSANQVR